MTSFFGSGLVLGMLFQKQPLKMGAFGGWGTLEGK